jgi:hypothetical protein
VVQAVPAKLRGFVSNMIAPNAMECCEQVNDWVEEELEKIIPRWYQKLLKITNSSFLANLLGIDIVYYKEQFSLVGCDKVEIRKRGKVVACLDMRGENEHHR